VGCFDVIFSGGFIEHFASPALVLDKIVDLLKPGGYLITTVPNLESVYWVIQRIIDKDLYQQHIKITKSELTGFYKSSGLVLDVVRYVGSFDLFAVDWSRLRSTSNFLSDYAMFLVGKTNASVNRVLHRVSNDCNSRLFSPFIVAIGHK
jgi:SAM-dependent methyltransferase